MRFERFGGTPEEIGRGRGEVYGSMLREAYDSFITYTGAEKARAEKLTDDMRKAVERSFPDLVEEMKATAAACGMGYSEMVLLTYCEEIGRPGGCSQGAVLNTEVGPIYMKSEDAGPGAFDNTYVMTELSPETGHRLLYVGPLSWTVSASAGINDAGLSIGDSSVGYTDAPGGGVPRLTLLRAALQYCSNVKEATDFYGSHSTAIVGGNTLMVDASGDAAVVEKSASRQSVREPDDGVIWCTNHPILGQMKEVWDVAELKEGREENSRGRWAKLEEFMEGHRAEGAIEAFEGILRSHGRGEICQHGLLWTLLSMITIPARREMLVTDGPPCEGEFVSYRLS